MLSRGLCGFFPTVGRVGKTKRKGLVSTTIYDHVIAIGLGKITVLLAFCQTGQSRQTRQIQLRYGQSTASGARCQLRRRDLVSAGGVSGGEKRTLGPMQISDRNTNSNFNFVKYGTYEILLRDVRMH